MALDVLLDAIAAEGEAEAARILDTARATAAEIRAEADAAAERVLAAATAQQEVALRGTLEARRARAVRAARERILRARAQCFDALFANAERDMPGWLDRAPPGALAALVQEALGGFPAGAAHIRCRPGLAQRIAALDPGVVVVPDASTGEGFVAESVDGRARVDNTLTARLQRQRPVLAIRIDAALEEGA